jgi:hypothetical protein
MTRALPGRLRIILNERIRRVGLVLSPDVVRRFARCQTASGTGALDVPRDQQCATLPVFHFVLYSDQG